MSIHVAIRHRTEYRFEKPVSFTPHRIRLRPAPHTRTPVHQYSLKIEPGKQFLNWQQDPFGNFIAYCVFLEQSDHLSVDVELIAELVTINPFDFFVDEYAQHYPFDYESQLRKELTPYFETKEQGPRLREWVASQIRGKVPDPADKIVDYLVALNQRLQRDVSYVVRLEPGIQTCEETLNLKMGSCRDTAWLLVQVLRHLGLAARFVSGYLVQLAPDVKSLEGPSGPAQDFTDLHAWAEVYIPGAGWLGLDPTSGLFAGEGHIPLACTPDPVSAVPISGSYLGDKVESTFHFENTVARIWEDPRVTKPYSDRQWPKIMSLGRQVDERLQSQDVRLTLGGEPTFVSIDDMESAQWNTAALGSHKLERARVLLHRLHERWASNGVLHYGQGKWYPGEPLPRWSLNSFWRQDGKPIWHQPRLLANPACDYGAEPELAERFIRQLADRLGLPIQHIHAAYEDGLYYLWKEGILPENLNVLDSRLRDPLERARLRRLFQQGLDLVVGYVLPIAWQGERKRWISSPWRLRRKHLFLLPGDSPMGLRLPLDSLIWEPEDQRQRLIPRDPFAPREELPEAHGEVHARYLEPATLDFTSLDGDRPDIREQGYADLDEDSEPPHLVRTAICVQPREGRLHCFLPPLIDLSHWLSLVAAIESTAAALDTPVVLEGYEPPRDERLRRLAVTPDPGVIEVNVPPVGSWDALIRQTEVLYEEARLARLGTEKFMQDGRHSGTGGGNHVTLGGPTPDASPLLRRPHLLSSLVTYWQHHPALSYLFSGLFVGPTSQAPRVDEARDDSLYELSIAFSQLARGESTSPWLVDRVLRNLLVDVTGNTHRTEFCIDKLYSPETPAGRLGLVEFRAFEMPPHWRMSAVQMLLLRALVAHFWHQPYDRDLVRWGTELHDRFMLPHYVEADLADVVADLNRWGYAFDQGWFAPFTEFRFPRYGSVQVGDLELELRFAIEPWHVLGEEVTAQGTARFVDSSLERLQVKVRGMIEGRHAVLCNGHRVPLRRTSTRSEYVAGVRYKAWQPPSGLHPNIGVHAPLVFDLVDIWNGRSLGGCTYYVSHPGGRHYDTFPVNAYEAEGRRLARFSAQGHTPGAIDIPTEPPAGEHPYTLDLRTTLPSEESPWR